MTYMYQLHVRLGLGYACTCKIYMYM